MTGFWKWVTDHLLPPADWWFTAPPNRPRWHIWRAHVPAHVGHGAIFLVVWALVFWLVATGRPLAAAATVALWESVKWEAGQRELWVGMPMNENTWDIILSAAGIGLAVLAVRGWFL